jgi:hypothetical protein
MVDLQGDRGQIRIEDYIPPHTTTTVELFLNSH